MFIRALVPYRYGNKSIMVGSVHEARDKEGGLLVALGRAEVAEAPKIKKKGYKTKVMRPE